MATTKERILITLAPSAARALRACAAREKTPRATIAARAIHAWIENEEDKYLSAVGDTAAARPGKLIEEIDFWKSVEKRRAHRA